MTRMAASGSVKTRAPARKPTAAARPVRRTHAQRREQAEQRLLEAALAIVAQRGSIRMTLAEIGEAAGYSRGLPAHRFGSKAGLLRSLVAYIGERFKAEREAWPKRAPGLDAIRGTISIYFSRKGPGWTTTRALLVMMTEGFMASSALRADIADYNRAALAYFENHIRYGIASRRDRARHRPGGHRGDPARRDARRDDAVADRRAHQPAQGARSAARRGRPRVEGGLTRRQRMSSTALATTLRWISFDPPRIDIERHLK